MKLYYAPGTCALACWIALEWANADYEVEKIDYASAEYKKVNPLGMVPALDIGGSRAMTRRTPSCNTSPTVTPPPASTPQTAWKRSLNSTKP